MEKSFLNLPISGRRFEIERIDGDVVYTELGAIKKDFFVEIPKSDFMKGLETLSKHHLITLFCYDEFKDAMETIWEHDGVCFEDVVVIMGIKIYSARESELGDGNALKYFEAEWDQFATAVKCLFEPRHVLRIAGVLTTVVSDNRTPAEVGTPIIN